MVGNSDFSLLNTTGKVTIKNGKSKDSHATLGTVQDTERRHTKQIHDTQAQHRLNQKTRGEPSCLRRA